MQGAGYGLVFIKYEKREEEAKRKPRSKKKKKGL
jgi:hypothetical protein